MKIEPDAPHWIWYDEVAIINWDAFQEGLKELATYGSATWFIVDESFMLKEEKPVKQIDFSKPLQGATDKRPVKVVQEGLTLLQHDNWYSVVDEQGRTHAIASSVHTPGSISGVENKPEEPKDHLCVYKYRGKDWEVGFQYTQAGAEDWQRRNKPYFESCIIVKVPV